ncbi:MAG: class I SAM-dependent methyltransferase [Candidatus Freyarchaeum deiterrae]
MKVDLSGVPETLLMALWGRAKVSKEDNPVLKDSKAIEIVENLIEYDFAKLDKHLQKYTNFVWLVRARMFDDTVRRFTAEHPEATIVNLGAGLDTTFFRVDNGSIKWYDLDLHDVIEIRKKIMPETDRMKCMAKSLMDTRWMKDIKDIKDGILFFSGGVLVYFEETEIKKLLSKLADRFPGGEIVFDTMSPFMVSQGNKLIKDSGIENAFIKWGIDDTKAISKWDPRITVLEDYTLYSRIENKNYWGQDVVMTMDYIDKTRGRVLFT